MSDILFSSKLCFVPVWFFENLWLLSGDPTTTQLLEKMVIDHLLCTLPRRYQRLVSMRNPNSLSEVVEAVEHT